MLAILIISFKNILEFKVLRTIRNAKGISDSWQGLRIIIFNCILLKCVYLYFLYF